MKVEPCEWLHNTDELRKLILENPDLPLLVFAGQEANSYDFSLTACTCVHARIGEVMDCSPEEDNERIYEDRDEFKDMLDSYYDDFEGTDAEFDKFIADKLSEYEPHWKKCIILTVDN